MDESEPFYKIRSPNRQVRTYAYLHTNGNETQSPQSQIRDSFKSANNLNTSEIYHSVKNRRMSNSPIQPSLDRELSTNKSRSIYKQKSKIKDPDGGDSSAVPEPQQADSEKQTIKVSNDRLSRYETIVNLTEQQNENLKQQNQFLLQKLRKMQQREDKIKKLYQKTKSYKLRWMETRNQIDIVKEETYIYRSLLQDYKQIAMVDIPVLKQKVEETNEIVNDDHLTVPMSHMPKSKKQKIQYDSSSSQRKRNMILEDYGRIQELTEQQRTFQENSPMQKTSQHRSKLFFKTEQN